MKEIFRLLIIIIILVISQLGYGQTVKLSDEIIDENGVQYYIHKVSRKQTLYSISKAYNVTQRKIAELNPEVINGVETGMRLKIPYTDSGSENPAIGNEDEFIMHTVKKSQTVYSLSKKYGVEVDDIFENNPNAANGINEGDIIYIPKSKITKNSSKVEVSSTKSGNKIVHVLKENETLFSISLKYGVDVLRIIDANPHIINGLSAGMKLYIPVIYSTSSNQMKVQQPFTNDPLKIDLGNDFKTNEPSVPCGSYKYSKNELFNVALMLPLYLDDNEKVNPNSSEESDLFYKNSDKFMQFYFGALIAADSLKKEGISFNLYLYDTQRSTTAINSILKEPELPEMDLIIGPVYKNCMTEVAGFADKYQINMVSPLAHNNDLYKYNPNIFQVNPSIEYEIEANCKYIADIYDQNIVVIHKGSTEEKEMISQYKIKLKTAFAKKSMANDIVFKEIDFSAQSEVKTSFITDALSKRNTNIIIMMSENEVFISDVLNKLNLLSFSHDIKLFGLQSWLSLKNIELEYLHSCQFHYFTSTFTDYQNAQTQEFIQKYRAYILAEPTEYSFQGYDIVYYFMNMLRKYGKNFQYCIDSPTTEEYNNGLQLEFDFRKELQTGGYINKGTHIIQYTKDYNLLKVD